MHIACSSDQTTCDIIIKKLLLHVCIKALCGMVASSQAPYEISKRRLVALMYNFVDYCCTNFGGTNQIAERTTQNVIHSSMHSC